MENLNAEQVIKELENQTKFAKFTNSTGVLLSAKCAQFCLDHVQYYEQKIKELTEENERLKLEYVGFEAGAKQFIEKMRKSNAVLIEDNHILETEFKDKVKADTVRKMQERLKQYIDVGHYRSPTEICFSELDVANIIDRITKEMLESENER